jgi:hypothetical protein
MADEVAGDLAVQTGPLSELEAQILIAVNHCGWHAELWFPCVQHDLLNFASPEPDGVVWAAIVGLIIRGVLREAASGRPPFVPPDWEPTPETLAEARHLLDG